MAERELTEDSFNLFLTWLDSDREQAGKKYEDIRRRLIVMFDGRGCAVSEDLADETINRVVRRLPSMIESYSGDPVPYFYTVARHLYSEYIEKRSLPLPEKIRESPPPEERREREEQVHQCLERCLEQLDPKNRELVVNYYEREKQGKIDFRKQLAERMGLALNALRIKMHRIRVMLQECINECLDQNLQRETK